MMIRANLSGGTAGHLPPGAPSLIAIFARPENPFSLKELSRTCREPEAGPRYASKSGEAGGQDRLTPL